MMLTTTQGNGDPVISAFDFDLDAALEEYPLKVPDTEMNRDQIAKAFATSANSIDSWISKGMPVLERGGNGKAYRLQLSACYAWHSAWKVFEDQRKLQADNIANQLALEFLNVDQTEEGLSSLSSRELEEFSRREQLYNATAEGRRNRVLREDVLNLMSRVFQIIREYQLTQPDELERLAGLSPNQTAAAVKLSDAHIIELKNAIEDDPIFAEVGATTEDPSISNTLQ